jgi:hypothetical protein
MLEFGQYPCVLHHPNGRSFPATAVIETERDVVVHAYEWPFAESESWSPMGEPTPMGNVLCELRLGTHLILIDAVAQELLPQQLWITSPLTIAAPPGYVDLQSKFLGAETQISNCHRVFGTWPIHSVEWPKTDAEHGTERYSAYWNADSKVEVKFGEIDLGAEFYRSYSLADRYGFELTSRPMLTLTSPAALSPMAWLAEYLQPLRDLVSLATLEEQRITVAALDHPENATSDREVGLALYSRHIGQTPYKPGTDPIRDGQTLFTLRDLSIDGHDLLDSWQNFCEDLPGVVDPLVAALTKPAATRSLFLGLAQSLEGIHAYRFAAGAIPREEHKARLNTVLSEVKDAGVSHDSMMWLKRWVNNRGDYSLEERLRQLASDVTEDVAAIPGSHLDPVAIPAIRNGMSHGARSFTREELSPHVRSMAIVGIAQLLRILGVPPTNVSRFFR